MRNPIQNIYIKKVEKKKLFGYDKDELWKHRHQDLSACQSILDLRKGIASGAAGL